MAGGAFIASPADEAIVSIGTLGAGLAVAPAQAPLTLALGSAVAFAGFTMVQDEVEKW